VAEEIYNYDNDIKFDFKLTDYIGIIINNKTDELYNTNHINNYDSIKTIMTLLANKIIMNIK